MGHRDQLLTAARRLLEERGYAHITARDLVAESGTNLASIGYHFGSKEGLLHEAIETAFDDWATALSDLVMADPAATPLERAWTTWSAVVDAMPRRHAMIRAYIEALAQSQRDPALQARLALHLHRLRTMVAERAAAALNDGTSPDDPRCQAIASFVLAVCDGLSVQYLLDPGRAPNSEQLLDGLAAVFRASIGQAPDVSASRR